MTMCTETSRKDTGKHNLDQIHQRNIITDEGYAIKGVSSKQYINRGSIPKQHIETN